MNRRCLSRLAPVSNPPYPPRWPLTTILSKWPALCQDRCRIIAEDLPLRRLGICTWATRAPSGPRGSVRGTRAGHLSCAWKISIPTAVERSMPTPRWMTCAGWESAGMKARTKAAHSVPMCRANDAPYISMPGANFATVDFCSPADARAKIWRARSALRMSVLRQALRGWAPESWTRSTTSRFTPAPAAIAIGTLRSCPGLRPLISKSGGRQLALSRARW